MKSKQVTRLYVRKHLPHKAVSFSKDDQLCNELNKNHLSKSRDFHVNQMLLFGMTIYIYIYEPQANLLQHKVKVKPKLINV